MTRSHSLASRLVLPPALQARQAADPDHQTVCLLHYPPGEVARNTRQ